MARWMIAIFNIDNIPLLYNIITFLKLCRYSREYGNRKKIQGKWGRGGCRCPKKGKGGGCRCPKNGKGVNVNTFIYEIIIVRKISRDN